MKQSAVLNSAGSMYELRNIFIYIRLKCATGFFLLINIEVGDKTSR